MRKRIIISTFSSMLLLIVAPLSLAESVIDGYNQAIKSTQEISPLGPDLFNENTSLLDGTTVFKAVDVVLKTNGQIPLSIGRKLNINAQTNDHFGGRTDWSNTPFGEFWDLDIPYMKGTFDAVRGWVGSGVPSIVGTQNRCSQAGNGPPPVYGVGPFYQVLYDPSDFFSGIEISIPGLGSEEILNFVDSQPRVINGVTYYGLTKSNWRIGCTPSITNGAGEGFVVLTPDGSRYRFDWMVRRATTGIIDTTCLLSRYFRSFASSERYYARCSVGQSVPRQEIFLYVTEATDRFGNTLTYSYDPSFPQSLMQIRSNDGAAIDLSYDANQRVRSISAGSRTWSYGYSGRLAEVILPDGTKWEYSDSGNFHGVTWNDGVRLWRNCKVNIDTGSTSVPPAAGETAWIKIKHPSGAVGEFNFRRLIHGTKQSEVGCYFAVDFRGQLVRPVVVNPSAYQVVSLYRKSITGPGMAGLNWEYDYQPSWVAPYQSITKITDSAGIVYRHRFGNDSEKNYGLLLETTVGNGTDVVEKRSFDYVQSSLGQNFSDRAGSLYSVPGASRARGFTALNRPLISTKVTQDGTTLARQVNQGCISATAYCFDSFVRPLSALRYSPWYSRTDSTEYYDDLSLWVLGQVKTTTTDGILASRTDYWADSALPMRTWSFGKAQQYFTYRADGTLASVTDGNNNTVTLSSWKRGIPQAIQYPATPSQPSGTAQSAVVNDAGWITAVTNEAGFTTGYGYDGMGRLASMVHPGGDTVAWNNWNSSFRPLTAADWKPPGVTTGQWHRVEWKGGDRKITYFDAMWRPVIQHVYDSANTGATLSATRTAYDEAGRVAFQSYPSSELIAPSQGMWTLYDELGRTTSVSQDSEQGLLTTFTEYLPGFQTRTTNPRQQTTTTSYQAYDQPSYEHPVLIDAPEGTRTQITRDVFGKPLEIKRLASP